MLEFRRVSIFVAKDSQCWANGLFLFMNVILLFLSALYCMDSFFPRKFCMHKKYILVTWPATILPTFYDQILFLLLVVSVLNYFFLFLSGVKTFQIFQTFFWNISPFKHLKTSCALVVLWRLLLGTNSLKYNFCHVQS